MNQQPPLLPASLIDLAETLGLKVALQLVAAFGGREMRFPKEPGDDHPVIKALGAEAGRAVCQFLGGQVIYVPHARPAARRQEAAALAGKGMTRGEIARALGLSQRHVRRLANGMPRQDVGQPDLFDREA